MANTKKIGSNLAPHVFDTEGNVSSGNSFEVRNDGVLQMAVDAVSGKIVEGLLVTIVPPSGVSATDIANIEAAIAALNAEGGGTVQLTEGTYDLGSTGIDVTDINNVTVQGVGPGTLIEFNSANGAAFKWNATSVKAATAINSYSQGATSIFTTTAGNASGILAGDWILISGTNGDTGDADREYNLAAANGDGGTGEIQLTYRTNMDMSSATIIVYRNNRYNVVRDLRLQETGNTSDRAIFFQNSDFCRVENIDFTGPGEFRLGCIDYDNGANMSARNITVSNMDNTSGINLSGTINALVKDCTFRGLNISGIGSKAAIFCDANTHDCRIIGNQLYDIDGDAGIFFDDTDSTRNMVANNILINIAAPGIRTEGNDLTVANNILKNCTGGGISMTSNRNRVQITGNKIINPDGTGILISSGGADYTITGNIVHSSAIGILTLGITGTVSGNTITNPSSDGLNIGGTQVAVVGNAISDGSGNGIHITDGAEECTVSNNTITNCASNGIHLRSNANGQISRCIIEGNILSRSTAAGNGILVTGGAENWITNNIIRGYSTNAVRLEDSADPHVADDNTIKDNDFTGLNTTDASTGTNNRIWHKGERAVLSGTDVDFAASEYLTKTLSANTTLTISNPTFGKTVRLEVDSPAGETFALPGSVTVIGGGTYDTGGAVNYIEIYCTDQATPAFIARIEQ